MDPPDPKRLFQVVSRPGTRQEVKQVPAEALHQVVQGPHKYAGCCCMYGLFHAIWIVSLILKLLLFVGLLTDNIITYGKLPVQLFAFECLMLPPLFNFWQLCYMWGWDNYTTIIHLRRNFCRNTGFYLCLFDVVILFAYPFCVELGHPNPIVAERHYQIAAFVDFIVICLDIISLVLIFNYDHRNHDPYGKSHRYFPVEKYEECAGGVKVLSIVQSSPFLITIRNACEKQAVHGIIQVERIVRWQSSNCCSWTRNRETHVCFSVGINLSPGQELNLIPETHDMPGALRIQHHRSFGNERGEQVITSVATNTGDPIHTHSTFSALVEVYSSDRVEYAPLGCCRHS